jgi:hypothetical protein
MRSALLAGGTALALALAPCGRVAADPAPYAATVTAPDAEVRSGPSVDAKFYPTNRLRRGDVVQVLKERPDGWLEVRPPEGSFSWINTRYVSQPFAAQPNNYVVTAQPGEKVPVMVGGELVEAKPTVEGARLERATQVRRYEKAGHPGMNKTDADGTWMPIEPPAAEVRYLRSDALSRPPPAPSPAAAPGLPAPGAAPGSTFVPAPGPQAAASDRPTHAELDELYARAVAAERAGDVNQAAQLYSRVAALGLPINHAYAREALNHAYYLLRGTGAAAPAVDSRVYSMPAEPPPPPSARLARPFPPAPGQPAAPAAATFTTSRQPGDAGAAPRWVGRLRRAGRGIGDRPTYVLESARGVPILYANPGPGVDLESLVGRDVELVGNAVYYGEVRANYMAVTQVRQVP